MILIRAVTALLWMLLAAFLFALAVVLFFPEGLSGVERAISAAVIAALAAPLALQLRTVRARTREMLANRIELDEGGVRIRLDGSYRTGKGLPEVPETRLPWSEIKGVPRERRKFVYPSLIPFEYPLDVYTIEARTKIPFTKECLPNAASIAAKIAAYHELKGG
jgi:uncharacterized protein (DUF58 family)